MNPEALVPQTEVNSAGANPTPGTPPHMRGQQGGRVRAGERPRVNSPGHGDSREGSTTRGERTPLTRKEAAMVEMIWGAK